MQARSAGPVFIRLVMSRNIHNADYLRKSDIPSLTLPIHPIIAAGFDAMRFGFGQTFGASWISGLGMAKSTSGIIGGVGPEV